MTVQKKAKRIYISAKLDISMRIVERSVRLLKTTDLCMAEISRAFKVDCAALTIHVDRYVKGGKPKVIGKGKGGHGQGRTRGLILDCLSPQRSRSITAVNIASTIGLTDTAVRATLHKLFKAREIRRVKVSEDGERLKYGYYAHQGENRDL